MGDSIGQARRANQFCGKQLNPYFLLYPFELAWNLLTTDKASTCSWLCHEQVDA